MTSCHAWTPHGGTVTWHVATVPRTRHTAGEGQPVQMLRPGHEPVIMHSAVHALLQHSHFH